MPIQVDLISLSYIPREVLTFLPWSFWYSVSSLTWLLADFPSACLL